MRKTFTAIALFAVFGTLAVLAFSFASCEKDPSTPSSTDTVAPIDTVTPTDTISPIEDSNPLVGTHWLNHFDTVIYGMHIITEFRCSFDTDSTGFYTIYTEVVGTDVDEDTQSMHYTYDNDTHIIAMTFVERNPITLIYDPEEQILYNPNSPSTIFYKVE